MNLHLQEELEKRGFLNQYTNEKLFDLYDQWGKTFYVGMDPTADSLHLWNFVGFMHAVQYMRRGNKLIFIVGWATGMIGDPGGKGAEREFLDEETLQQNVKALEKQVTTIFENLEQLTGHPFDYEVKNNIDFYKDMSFIDFLRQVGKYITVNNMMSKETVKRRIEDPDQSISYTEFSYMLMQAYDFLKLYEEENCELQIAWSDQRWNLVTWIELIRKKLDEEAYGVTSPLVLDSTGKKFGKSAGNAIWLDQEKNSPYTVYQYFMNTADEDIGNYLRLFTLLGLEQIDEIVEEHNKNKAERIGQQKLAYYVTMTLFGQEAADNADLITCTLFGDCNPAEEISEMTASQLTALHTATWWATVEQLPVRIIEAVTSSGLTSSNGESKKMIKQWCVFLNEEKIDDINFEITNDHLLADDYFCLRKGKKSYALVKKQK